MPDISSRSGVRITYFMAKQANEPKHPENASPRKKITGLIVVLIMLAVLVMLVSGPLAYRCVIRHNLSGANACVAGSPETPTPEPTEAPTPTPEPTEAPTPEPTEEPTPEPQYPVFKNGRRVTSAEELSRFDKVTFGNYPQISMGFDAPIEWYVINVEGNKVQLLSVYCLDSMPFHNKNEEVTFRSSDIYRWLNGSFRERAFNADEQAMLAREILLPNKAEAFKLPQSYRAATGTDHAISQGYNDKQNIWWLGDDSKVTYSYDYWDVTENYCALAMIADGSDAWEFKVTFNGKGIRPMIVIQF